MSWRIRVWKNPIRAGYSYDAHDTGIYILPKNSLPLLKEFHGQADTADEAQAKAETKVNEETARRAAVISYDYEGVSNA